jgi:hypothetical protein
MNQKVVLVFFSFLSGCYEMYDDSNNGSAVDTDGDFDCTGEACLGPGDADADADCTGDACLAHTGTEARFDGVDILLAVDNSSTMSEEQETLSLGLVTLINSLSASIPASKFDAANDLHIAVVTSNLGVMYGRAHETALSPTDTITCGDIDGDLGQFRTIDKAIVSSGAGQGDVAKVGTGGCGFEQPLEAAVAGLEVNGSGFIVKSHLLTVIVVSDEEDCSINDPALFNTPEWLGSPDEYKDLINVACNWHNGRMDNRYLFEPSRYYDTFINGFKGGMANAVIFAAIVGVPAAETDPACEGPGDMISGCLYDANMQLFPVVFYDSVNRVNYSHFATACTHPNPNGGEPITMARPGRRYVEVAQMFGQNGYVFSICNSDWSPAMETIAAGIAGKINP